MKQITKSVKKPSAGKIDKLIISTLLMMINLKCRRSRIVNLSIPKLGTIHTHRKKKRVNKIKYQKKQNKKNWREQKKKMLQDENYLLF